MKAEVLRQVLLNIVNKANSGEVARQVPNILENRWMASEVTTRMTHLTLTAEVATLMTSNETTEGTTGVA